MKLLSHSQLKLLSLAIDDAAAWRAEMLGSTSDEADEIRQTAAIANFDARIDKMHAALKLVKEQQRFIRAVNANSKD